MQTLLIGRINTKSCRVRLLDKPRWSGLLDKELVAPVIPNVQDETDTSNFDPYPDSVTEAAAPVFQGKDPFAEF